MDFFATTAAARAVRAWAFTSKVLQLTLAFHLVELVGVYLQLQFPGAPFKLLFVVAPPFVVDAARYLQTAVQGADTNQLFLWVVLFTNLWQIWMFQAHLDLAKDTSRLAADRNRLLAGTIAKLDAMAAEMRNDALPDKGGAAPSAPPAGPVPDAPAPAPAHACG